MMKPLTPFIAILILLVSFTSVQAQTFAESRAVPAYVVINKTTPSITLNWEATTGTVSFKVYRRALGSKNWGVALITLASTVTSYEDLDITVSTIYEYSIVKLTNTVDPLSSNGDPIEGYGYVSAAIEKPAIHSNGIMWVLIANNINDSMPADIETLKTDLAADGWNVYSEIINETALVSDVKAFIESKRNTIGCDAVYLLGHLPVPYSGVYCQDDIYKYPPDGHNETDPNSHCGAWIADVYYGTTSGTWTDTDSTTLAKRPENDNLLGDGKFDNHRIPGEVGIAVGRVDFYNMPQFTKSEVELTRQYLNKAHDFKIAQTQVVKQGIVEDNFAGQAEGFSSAAIRDFTAIAGENGIVRGDLFQTTRTDDYLMAYVCGAGFYVSCNGVGYTDSFTVNNAAVFNHIFGSFFGDFDIKNNFMRASLATEKLGLTCIWSGRPKWVTHTLALGENYADATLRSQNNWLDYDGNYYQNGAHMALLGDPSLRHDMLYPPSNVKLGANGTNNAVDVSWTATTETDIAGYHVYRSHKPSGGFVLLNTVPVSISTFTDDSPYDGTNHYMVRAAKETATGSGSYMNLSLGVSEEINGLEGLKAGVTQATLSNVKVYPTLVENFVVIEKDNKSAYRYRIQNNIGSVLLAGSTSGNISQLDLSALPSGMYYLIVDSKTYKLIKH